MRQLAFLLLLLCFLQASTPLYNLSKEKNLINDDNGKFKVQSHISIPNSNIRKVIPFEDFVIMVAEDTLDTTGNSLALYKVKTHKTGKMVLETKVRLPSIAQYRWQAIPASNNTLYMLHYPYRGLAGWCAATFNALDLSMLSNATFNTYYPEGKLVSGVIFNEWQKLFLPHQTMVNQAIVVPLDSDFAEERTITLEPYRSIVNMFMHPTEAFIYFILTGRDAATDLIDWQVIEYDLVLNLQRRTFTSVDNGTTIPYSSTLFQTATGENKIALAFCDPAQKASGIATFDIRKFKLDSPILTRTDSAPAEFAQVVTSNRDYIYFVTRRYSQAPLYNYFWRLPIASLKTASLQMIDVTTTTKNEYMFNFAVNKHGSYFQLTSSYEQVYKTN